ncbi:CoA transferase [Edaphovirga cremea]|uniref:CoA transferase n=1 Tax=Edaphovirga cremea TaxID=2267246 RepID=UPI003989BC16
MDKNNLPPAFGPLAGVKVLVSGVAYAGPFAASLMADYGAEVLSIESTVAPDMIRTGSVFQQMHRNQRAIAMNVPTDEGREIFLKLIKEHDIFIESSKAGQWGRWGLDDEALWESNPKLVIAHVSGFGQTGLPEYTSRGSWDAIGQAFGGISSMNGLAEPEPPMITNPYVCDYYTAIYASWACLAAYIKAQKTGKGDSIDIAQYETLIYSMGDALMNYLNKGIEYKRAGLNNPKYGAWKTYTCKDGSIYCAPAGISAMKKGLPFLGLQHGSEDIPENWQFTPTGTKGAKLLEEKLAEYCAGRTVDEADRELNKVGILASPIMTHDRMEDHPQYKARQVIAQWDDADGKPIKGPNTLLRFKNNPGTIWRGAPKYGSDNEEVLSGLGYSAEEIAKFYKNKILTKVTS